MFEAIRAARPPRLYLACDGPRPDRPEETAAVEAVRTFLVEGVDWECETHTLFRPANRGCKRAVEEALAWYFEREEAGIVLEDDCVPTPEFFRFCAWGLEAFAGDPRIGMVSGSNLIDYRRESTWRNGYSRYVNIWGWATWRDRWAHYEPQLSLRDLSALLTTPRILDWMTPTERTFWAGVLKHAITFQATWDFHVQFQFFRRELLSVFPARNLVLNVGFGPDATHTSNRAPEFWERSRPDPLVEVLSRPVLLPPAPDLRRDRELARTIWNCTAARTARLWIMNLVRYLRA